MISVAFTYIMAKEALDKVRIFRRDVVCAVDLSPFIGDGGAAGVCDDHFILNDLAKFTFHEQIVLAKSQVGS